MDLDILIVLLLAAVLTLLIMIWLRPRAGAVVEERPVIVRNVYPSDWAWDRGGWARPWWGHGPWWHHRVW